MEHYRGWQSQPICYHKLMLSTGDIKIIEKVMRKVMSEVMDEKLDNKLKPLYDFKDETMCLLKAIRGLLQGKINPENHHVSVL